MEPFIVGIDITSTKDLFGKNREIETLISCAKRKGNAGIIGARRFTGLNTKCGMNEM